MWSQSTSKGSVNVKIWECNKRRMTDFDPVKRLGSMALQTALRTDKVCKKTLPTPVFGRSNSVTSGTIWASLRSSKISPSCPTCHLIEVRLAMEFLPDDVWPFLEWASAFRCNKDAGEILPKRDFVSSSEVAAPIEPRYPSWCRPPTCRYTILHRHPVHNSDHRRASRMLSNPTRCWVAPSVQHELCELLTQPASEKFHRSGWHHSRLWRVQRHDMPQCQERDHVGVWKIVRQPCQQPWWEVLINNMGI